MNRTALISALKYVASEVTFEEQAAYYKSREYKPIYPKICTVKPISTMNSVNYHQTSSVIASSEL
ncbi:MAG: hypothetical protein KJ888_20995, partial [Gammaproteobacteria bacterium]|nr:hypothetical protein [Gammaproteobacteria bacterium]